jgi:hypothetical protein
VTTACRVPYAEQLAGKRVELQAVLVRLRTAYDSDTQQRQEMGAAPAAEADDVGGPVAAGVGETLVVHASPCTSAYRNKCELSFGPGPDGTPTLGFTLGRFREGIVTVVVRLPPPLTLPQAPTSSAHGSQRHCPCLHFCVVFAYARIAGECRMRACGSVYSPMRA